MNRWLLAGGLAPAAFVVVLLIQGAVRPGYDPVSHFGSELANGPWGWVQEANFIVTGLFVLAFAVGLRRRLAGGRGAVAAPACAAVWGLTLVVAGLFNADPLPGYLPVPPAPTLAGFVHNVSSIPNLVAAVAVVMVLAARFAAEPRQRAWMWYSIATGLVVVAAWALTIATFAAAQGAGNLATSHHGLWQRISIVAAFCWFGALAVKLLRDADAA